MSYGTPTPPLVARQLERLLESRAFSNAEKAAPLLDLLVTATLKGEPPSEYDIARRIFDQEEDWTSTDPIVRINVLRLNKRLSDYYADEGSDDLVVIRIVGRTAVARHRTRLRFKHVLPRALYPDFVTALEHYFESPDTGKVHCVVSGEAAEWHHLDGDPYNNALGNLIPLSRRLSEHIEVLRNRRKDTGLSELEPRYLAGTLARRHFADWQIAAAYACAHLAFHLSELPFANESADLRLQHLADTLSHSRHRFNESVMAYLIRHSLLPLVTRISSLDPRSFCHLTLQLSGILDEAGYFEAAARGLALAQDIAQRFASLVYQPGSLNRFSILRRELQLLMERRPDDKAIDRLAKRAGESAQRNTNLPLTLHVVMAARDFRLGTEAASRQAYETLAPLAADIADRVFASPYLARPSRVDSSNLAQIFIFSGLAASRVRPKGWEEYAEEMFKKAKRLCRESGFSLPPEFWATVSEDTYKANPRALRVSLLSHEQVMPKLSLATRTDIETALSALSRLLIVEKTDPALNWKSPWSGPRVTL